MALSTFIKNLFGGGADNMPEDSDGPQNLNLSGAKFKQQLNDTANAVLLDVRTAGEFRQGSIPKAKNIDFLSPNFAQKVQNLDKDHTYFLFCRSGARSAQACKVMHKQGFDVRNLSGGIGAF